VQLLMSEPLRVFGERHVAIDALRKQRELGDPLAPETWAVQALLQEIDLLQIVAHTAEHIAGFPAGASADEPLTNLRNSLRRWKE